MIDFFAIGPRVAGAGGPSGTGEIFTDEPDSAFRIGRVHQFWALFTTWQGHHPWALLSGDDRIRQVSLALARISLSSFEASYCRRGPLLGRQGEWGATWSLKAGEALKWAENIGRLQP